jgi:hypothetical protein
MIQNVPPPYPGGEVEFHGTIIERITADNNYIHVVLYESVYLTNYEEWFYLMHKRRQINRSTWEAENIITTAIMEPSRLIKPVFSSDCRLNIICYIYPDNWDYPALAHYYLINNIWYGPLQISDQILDELTNFCLSANSNDLYAYWLYYPSNTLYRSQYDAAPLAPNNLTSYLDPDPSCNSCHGSGPGIRLDWTKNNEPDLSYYEIFRSEQTGCNSCHGSGSSSPPDSSSKATEPVTVSKECPALQGEITDFSSYEVEVETGCLSGLKSTQKITFEPIWAWSQNYWVDKNIQEDYLYFYFVKAKDVTGHESGQSNVTNTYVPPGSFNKIFSNFSSEVVPKIYSLYQNYPNPFNPSTTIHYQLPEDTYVKVEIFNSLGQLVKILVNDFKPEGYYSVTWNGDDDFNQPLPSGIYIYKMKTQQ